MGRDLGYLPGDIGEKLNPWMQPLYDNFDLIFARVIRRIRQPIGDGATRS